MDKHHKNKKTDFLAEVKQFIDLHQGSPINEYHSQLLKFVQRAYDLGHDFGYSQGYDAADDNHHDW